MLRDSFARVLKDLRAKQGLSQEELAHRARLHRTYISQLERGLKSPSLETLQQICQPLGLPMSNFIRLVERKRVRPNVK